MDFSTGPYPRILAIGDIDGDGKPDLAVVNNASPTKVSVYRNTSASGSITSSSFEPRVDFSPGANPYGIAIGDLDGDGKPDLAVVNNVSNTVSVFRNTSTSGSISAGSFEPKVDFATTSYPGIVAIGDLNGDGKPDVAVGNYGSNTLSVLRNAIEPQTPQNLTAEAGDGQVPLTWNRISENRFLRYRIYAGTSPSPTTKVDSTMGGDLSDTSKTITGLTNGTLYHFRVTAVDSSEIESEYSNEVSVMPGQPRILSVKDVPNDQGGRATIRWRASALDDQINNLPSYSIWRAIPEGLQLFAKKAMKVAAAPEAVRPRRRLQRINGVDYAWEWIANQPAHRFATYSYTASTLYDSMSTTDDRHYFLVSAQTSDPFVYYDSNVDSGYSVDNLSPASPAGSQQSFSRTLLLAQAL